MPEEHDVEGEKEEENKDIKTLLSVIPPASQLRQSEKKLSEKRIRVRYGNVKEGQLLLSPSLARELGLSDKAVIVVGGKKRFVLDIILDDNAPMNVAFMNQELMRENGIADNSIATLRKP